MINVCIPPRHDEVDAAYYADVIQLLSPAKWLDWRFAQMGVDGYVPMLYDGNLTAIGEAFVAKRETVRLPVVFGA
jgi:hypothetical protein